MWSGLGVAQPLRLPHQPVLQIDDAENGADEDSDDDLPLPAGQSAWRFFRALRFEFYHFVVHSGTALLSLGVDTYRAGRGRTTAILARSWRDRRDLECVH